MKIKLLTFFTIILNSCYVISQNVYNELPLIEKIRIKEQASVLYSTAGRPGQGTDPTVQTSPEQDCNSAIPVCQNVYTTAISYSGVGNNDEIPSNSCLGSNEKNSVWYTFSTSSAGNLAFNITPNSMGDDYDFALYDITNNNCSGIASGAITPVRCNFSATSGVTGLSASGSNASEPASGPNQSTVLPTTAGRTYVLIISNYSSSQSGYTLDFSPGTASIFDVTPPTITGVTAPCGSNNIVFNASEQIQCSSIAANASDFTITGTGGPYVVTAAAGQNCGINTAQINLTISPALSGAGPWTVGVTTGSDGNTLIDACGNAMAPQTQTFTTVPPAVTITGPTTVCKGVVFALTASSASSYTWTGAAVPAGQQNQQTISVTANAAGTLNFTVTVSNGSCGNSSASQAVTVQEGVTAHFTASTHTICAGQSVNFTSTSTLPCSYFSGLGLCTCGSFGCGATPQNSPLVLHTWAFGDPASGLNNFGTGATISHAYNSPGTYYINLNSKLLIGGNNCGTSETQTVIVLPATPILTISPSTTICPGQSSTLTVNGGNSYTWTPGATLNSTSAASVIATPTITTTYSVTAPGCGANQTATVQVIVIGNPPAIGPINGLTNVCNNQTGVTYSVNNVAATNYTWTVPAGVTITSVPTNSNAITVDFGASAGTISVSAASACGTATESLIVTISPSLNLTITPTNPVICPAGQANLVVSGATTYTWSGSNLNTTSGASVTASPIVTTIYTVNGSSGTCTGVATATVTVDNTNCNTGTCDVTQIRAALTAAGNIELLGMNDPCSLYFINPQYMTGPAAQSYAQTFGANLISVQSAAENAALITALSNQGYAAEVVWIGFGDGSSEGNFTWYDGAPVSYTNWSATEPNDAGGNEDCTQIYPDGTWNDLNCAGYNSLSVIEVNLCPQVSIANVPVHCSNTTVTLNASTLLGSPNYTYTWTQSGTETFTNTSTPGNTDQISVTSVGPNTFTATSVDRYSCQQFTTINLNVIATPTITANSATICMGQQAATLTANGASSYTWSPSASLSSPNGSVVIANPSVPTTYTIQGTSASGCVGTGTAFVDVSFLPDVYVLQKNSLCDTTILNWLNITSVTPTLAQGDLPSGLTVNATHSGGGMSTTPSMFSGGTFPATYSVPIAATTIRNDLGGTFNFCFNQQVINPQIAFASIGNGSLPITINTSVPYQIIWAGVNMTYPNPTTLIGQEGFTIIRFPGVHTCVSLDYIGNESYCNLAFGVMDADCQGRPICPGDPIELIANGASSYTWNTGATTSTIAPASFVTTTYSVVGVNAAGCSNTTTTTVVINPTPTVTANSATICVGQQTATLTANGAATYSWMPATGLSATSGSVVTGNPLSTQDYTVVGTDINGCLGATVTAIAVNTLPTVTVSTATICLGQQTATLNANGATNYTWSPSATLNSANGTSVTGTPSTTTNYTITGEDFNGCVNTATTDITVVNIPTVTVSSNATICPTSNTVLISGGATNYTWSPTVSLTNPNTATVTANPSVTTQYTVIGTDNNGCVASNTVEVAVASNPTITALSNVTICPAGSATLNASGGNTYTWSPAASLNSANGATVTSTPAITTTYSVSGENSNGCIATTTVEVFVANNPTITISPNVTVCPLAATTLTVGGATSYSWTPNTFLNNDNTASVISTPSTSTIYTVTGLLGICSSTNEVTVTVTNTVVVNASASDATICPLGSSTLTATGATSYTWSPALTLNTANGNTVVASPTTTETYTVIGSTSTCTNSAQVVITVTTNPIVSATSATICSGTNTVLTASGANTYTWSPAAFLNTTNGANVTANPPSTKTYTIVGASTLGCLGFTTTTVDVVITPTLSINANSLSICPGDNSTLNASGASNYTWSPASTLSNTTSATTIASPSITSTYLLTGSNGTAPNSCITTKTIQIVVKPTTTITVGNPDPICFGNFTKLEAHGGNSYNWQPSTGLTHPNDSVATAEPLTNTIYTVTVNKPGFCANTATVEVIVNPLPYVYAGADTVVNIDEAVTLFGVGNTQVGFLSPDSYPLNCNLCPVITVNPQENTCFILKGTSSDGCTNFDTVCVIVTKDWNVYIPNAFTPNNDGNNDLFMPYGYGIDKIEMTVFDRWGVQIFKSDAEHQGWDGKYKGMMCAQGVYVYQVLVTSMGGASMKKVGHVTLMPLIK